MAIEIVDFPIENGGSFHSYVSLPEGSFNDISQQRSRVGVDIVLIDVNCLFCCRIFMNFPNLSMPVEQSQVCWSWDVRRAVKKEHIGTHRNSVRTSNPGVFTVEATGQDSGRMGQRWSKQMGMDMSSQIRRTKRWRSKMSSSILKKRRLNHSTAFSDRSLTVCPSVRFFAVHRLSSYLFKVWRTGFASWQGLWHCMTLPYGTGSIPIKIPFLVGWTSINPSYFDVNYRGTGFWPIPIWAIQSCYALFGPKEVQGLVRSVSFILMKMSVYRLHPMENQIHTQNIFYCIWHCITLYRVMLCYTITMLYYTILYYTMLCHIILCFIMWHCIMLCYLLWCYIILHCIIFNSILLYYIILYRIVLYCIINIVLYCIINIVVIYIYIHMHFKQCYININQPMHHLCCLF